MKSKLDKAVDEALRERMRSMASKGGLARAKKYNGKTLRKWAKLGGRPKKKVA